MWYLYIIHKECLPSINCDHLPQEHEKISTNKLNKPWRVGGLLWQKKTSLRKQPELARPNAQSNPKSSCILVTPCHAGLLYRFWEGEPEHCAVFKRSGCHSFRKKQNVLGFIFPVCSSYWHCVFVTLYIEMLLS